MAVNLFIYQNSEMRYVVSQVVNLCYIFLKEPGRNFKVNNSERTSFVPRRRLIEEDDLRLYGVSCRRIPQTISKGGTFYPAYKITVDDFQIRYVVPGRRFTVQYSELGYIYPERNFTVEDSELMNILSWTEIYC